MSAKIFVPALLALLTLGSAPTLADEVLKPASDRFVDPATLEEPSFQRHVLPLMGRLGCNGRACHGSFQGQGGFRLSLFGYDFKADHDALLKGDKPRTDLAKPEESLILFKPTHEDEHEGGERMKTGSWQYNLLRRWVVAGGKDDSEGHASLARLEVIPAEIQFSKDGQSVQLQAIAHWSDGKREDVTPICRFQTNDAAVSAVDENGLVKATGTGDTHVIVFYDNGITAVPVIRPVSAEVAANYPDVPTPTKVDELVVQKLRKLGVAPSELSTDAEFLRRVSLDITGTLPTPDEVLAFTADKSGDKRAKKIDELLERPGYAAWWTTKLCDITGNNAAQLGNNQFRNEDSKQWYDWIEARLAKNMPYDEIVAGIVLASSRREGQSYKDYCEEMSKYYRKDDPVNFAEHDTMPHYWAKRNARNAEEKALGFAYAFLGVRLQCAQCHKHPFDQWSKQDFEHFTAFFNGIQYGFRKEDQAEREELQKALGLDAKKPNNEQQKEIAKMASAGKVVPVQEVYVRIAKTNANDRKGNKAKDKGGSRVITPKVLGGEEVATKDYGDLREALMEWMRSEENPYFARAIVNRVWANYFNVGIVEPPDDQNLANPPSNEPLLKHLTDEFVAHNYDLKWLHRTIANSRTYQLSWRPNPTNRLDTRNFSRSVPRRLPAEVAYDALRLATAGKGECETMLTSASTRAIGPTTAYQGGLGAKAYPLLTFGKPARVTNCDCERSTEPSLLQTLFLRNDGEMLTLTERGGGWLQEVGKVSSKKSPDPARTARGKDLAQLEKGMTRIKDQLAKLDREKDAEQREELLSRQKKLSRQIQKLAAEEKEAKAKDAEEASEGKVPPELVASRGKELVREAYLRTLSREPSDEELAKSLVYLGDSATIQTGMRDILWALLNTKEFIVNH